MNYKERETKSLYRSFFLISLSYTVILIFAFKDNVYNICN